MKNKRRNRKTGKKTSRGFFGRALKETKLAANVTEEQDWYLDSPDVRLTRIFAVVLVLHVVAVGGILAFKMIDKASENSGVQLAAASSVPKGVVQKQSTLAGKIDNREMVMGKTERVPASASSPASTMPSPLRRNPGLQDQYRVLAGETLVEIANKLEVDADALRKANAIRSDNELYPGRWLDLPSEEEMKAEEPGNQAKPEASAQPAAAIPAPAPTSADAASTASGERIQAPSGIQNTVGSSGKFHTVAPGETIWAIARKHGVDHKTLLSVNGIARPETLQIGQQLKLPAK